MPNIAQVLKTEISRLARKESRSEIDALRKAVSAQRIELASMKRRLAELERSVKHLSRDGAKGKAAARADANEVADDTGHRFQARGLATNRARLGLSAADFGLLVGTTGQSVYSWESGKSKPRAKALAAISALRGIGKKEVAERLAALKA